MPVVKETFTHKYGHGRSVEVPAGARVTRNYFAEGGYWVDPSIFADPIDRHDADHYGIRVSANNVKDLE